MKKRWWLLLPAGLLGVLGLLLWTGAQDVAAASPLGDPARCQAGDGIPAGWRDSPTAGMVAIRAGSFVPGSQKGYPDERPAGPRGVAGFLIDRTEVTNAQFQAFVEATGYVTEAEQEGGGAVFVPPDDRDAAPGVEGSWWRFARGANWRSPAGPGSDIAGRMNHPVSMVTLRDAQAYARWRGNSLPSELQWEYAAKGGLDDLQLDEVPRGPDGKPLANFWQGMFPYVNFREDGFAATAPVGCFAANPFGLHDAIGNVWEWTRDEYRGPHQVRPDVDVDISRVRRPASAPPLQAIIKGGSFLCAEDYCARFRAAARHPQEVGLPTAHVGFRTVRPLS